MEDPYDDEEMDFNNEQIEKLAKEAINQVFPQPTDPKKKDEIVTYEYERGKVNQWTQQIIDHAIKELAKLNKKFKYVVTCVIQQDVGAGLHSATCTYWEGHCDGYITVNLTQPTFTVFLTVFCPRI